MSSSMISISSSSSSSSGALSERSSWAPVIEFLEQLSSNNEWVKKFGLHLFRSSNRCFVLSRTLLADFLEDCNFAAFKRLEGDLHNRLAYDLGRQQYNALVSGSPHILGLHCIYYCVTGLESLRGSFGKSVAASDAVGRAASNVLQKLEAIVQPEPKDGSSCEISLEQLLNNIEELRSSQDIGNLPEIQNCLNKFPSAQLRSSENEEHEVHRSRIYKLVEELRSLLQAHLSRVRSLFNHDLLVLEFHDLQDSSAQRLFIKAEKLGAPQAQAGVNIQLENQFHLYESHNCVLFKHQFSGNQLLPFKKAEEILENFELDYQLGSSCCWDYAAHMCEALLSESAKLPGLDAAEKGRRRYEARAIPAKCSFESTIGLLFRRKK